MAEIILNTFEQDESLPIKNIDEKTLDKMDKYLGVSMEIVKNKEGKSVLDDFVKITLNNEK